MSAARAVRRGALVALLSAVSASSATAQDAWPARVQPAARSALAALADSARLAGLPVAPLHDKAAEGVLKGADDARIVAAVRKLVGELAVARATLGPTAPPDALVAGAAALRIGASREALRQLAGAGGARALAVPLGAVADLVSRGVPVDAAVQSVRRLAARGAGAADYVALSAAVSRDILAGVAPEAAVARAVETRRP